MRLLDLYCGAGGAAMGYHRAGFTEIVGVDIDPQPDYPFTFIQGDALIPPFDLDAFDLIHASPPCQAYSVSTPDKSLHPDLLGPTRDMLQTTSTPWVIENVPGAPICADYMLCGSMFGLGARDGMFYLRRHRYFEVSWTPDALTTLPPCQHVGVAVTVTGNGAPSGQRATVARYAMTVAGDGGNNWNQIGRNITVDEWREAMGMDWSNRRGLAEAIPPAYTEWIGRQYLEGRHAAV